MATSETRRQLLAAVQACEDKKGQDTRILELDPADSGLADFFLITSATNDRQVVAIADEIEFRLKKDFGLYASSVEGRRQAEWILLDYVDIVIHVFLQEKRAFYDIERLRKSARNLTASELEAELRSALAAKTRAVRKQAPPAKKTAKAAALKSPATSAATAPPKGDKVTAKKAAKKAALKKTAIKKAAVKPAPRPAKQVKAKPAVKAAAKPAPKPAKKAAAKSARKALGAVGMVAPSADATRAGLGAKPPILKCEDPDLLQKVGVTMPDQGAKPPIVKCEDPDGNIVTMAASAAKPALKSAKKAAVKAPLKAAAKKSKK